MSGIGSRLRPMILTLVLVLEVSCISLVGRCPRFKSSLLLLSKPTLEVISWIFPRLLLNLSRCALCSLWVVKNHLPARLVNRLSQLDCWPKGVPCRKKVLIERWVWLLKVCKWLHLQRQKFLLKIRLLLWFLIAQKSLWLIISLLTGLVLILL